MFRLGIIISLVSSSIVVHAQTVWEWAYPTPQGNTLRGAVVKSASFALTVGDIGLTLRRTNSAFSSPVYPTQQTLRAVCNYVDTFWVVGDGGTIYKSVTNGASWSNQSYSATSKVNLYTTAAHSKTNAWAAGDSGIILYTTDGGVSWSKQSNSYKVRINEIVWAKQTAYACGDTGTLIRGNFYGQQGWGKFPSGKKFPFRGISMDTNYVFVVGDSGYIMQHSILDQATVRDTNLDKSITLFDVASTEQYVIAVGSKGMIKRSNDTGMTWITPITNATENIYHIELAADFLTSGVAMAVGEDGLLLRSTNFGATWVRLDSGKRAVIYAAGRSPNGTLYATSGAGIVFRSTNDGISWKRDSINVAGVRLTDIEFDDTGFGLITSYDNKVLRTLDSGKTWTVQTIASSGTLLLGVSVHGTKALVCGTGGKVYETSNSGNTWTLRTTTTTQTLYDVTLAGNYAVACGEGGVVLYSDDAGKTWKSASSGTVARLQRAAFADSSDVVIIVGQAGVVLRSSTAGKTWSTVTTNLTQHLNGIVFRDIHNGIITGDAGTIMRTTDAGNSFKLDTSHTINDLKGAIIIDGNVAYVFGNKTTILRTSNSGLPVELISLRASRVDRSTVTIEWQTSSETNNGYFEIERLSGTGWQAIGQVQGSGTSSFRTYQFNDLSASSAVSEYRLRQYDLDGTSSVLGTVSVGGYDLETSSEIRLVPNPAADRTTVVFDLAEPMHTVVSIYDERGAMVKKVYDRQSDAGAYSITIPAGELASGTYRVIVSTDKMIRSAGLIITR